MFIHSILYQALFVLRFISSLIVIQLFSLHYVSKHMILSKFTRSRQAWYSLKLTLFCPYHLPHSFFVLYIYFTISFSEALQPC